MEKKKYSAAPCVVLNLTCTHDRSVRMLLLSGSLEEEHSNDLVTAMRKTVSSASFRGERTLKCLQTRAENVWTFQVLHCVYVQTDRRNCTQRWLRQLGASCFLVHFFWWDALGHKQVMIYGIVCWWTQSISKSGKIDVHHARSESGHSVWDQSQHTPSSLEVMLAYSLVSSPSILCPYPLPSPF